MLDQGIPLKNILNYILIQHYYSVTINHFVNPLEVTSDPELKRIQSLILNLFHSVSHNVKEKDNPCSPRNGDHRILSAKPLVYSRQQYLKSNDLQSVSEPMGCKGKVSNNVNMIFVLFFLPVGSLKYQRSQVAPLIQKLQNRRCQGISLFRHQRLHLLQNPFIFIISGTYHTLQGKRWQRSAQRPSSIIRRRVHRSAFHRIIGRFALQNLTDLECCSFKVFL